MSNLNKEEKEINNYVFSSDFIKRYDMSETKKNVYKMLDKYISLQIKYFNLVPPRITSSYEVRYENSSSTRRSDKVAYYVEKKFECEEQVNEFYKDVEALLQKMTKKEIIIFNHLLLKREVEDVVAERIDLSRKGMNPIKLSVILKVAIAFDIEVLK